MFGGMLFVALVTLVDPEPDLVEATAATTAAAAGAPVLCAYARTANGSGNRQRLAATGSAWRQSAALGGNDNEEEEEEEQEDNDEDHTTDDADANTHSDVDSDGDGDGAWTATVLRPSQEVTSINAG